MNSDPRARTTEIVARLGHRDRGGAGAPASAVEELMPLVYDELRQLAHRYMAREREGHVLQPTALVHEAYLRLVDQRRAEWRGRTHFFAVGAMMMRRILVDQARRAGSEKRGGDWLRVTFDDVPDRQLDLHRLLALHESLERLAELDEREARVVELRLFAGLTVDEVAEALGVTSRTVERDWKHARVWLADRLGSQDGDGEGHQAGDRAGDGNLDGSKGGNGAGDEAT